MDVLVHGRLAGRHRAPRPRRGAAIAAVSDTSE
jgi:hypothetical protein